MHYTAGHIGAEDAIVALITASFTAAETAQEGALVGDLARQLMATTPPEDLYVFCAVDRPNDADDIVGAICLSRLRFSNDPRTVFILSPVAVATERQKTGIGHALITYGLDQLRKDGVSLVMTYGDPNYYGRFGFVPVTEAFAQAPLALSYPKGWQANVLDQSNTGAFVGPSTCVAALDNPALW